MRLKLQERQDSDVTILELEGALILGPEVDTLRNHIRKLLKARKVKIVLQLEKLKRLDSVGVGTLIQAATSARSAGGDVRLLQLSKPASDVLSLLRLDRMPGLLRTFLDEQEVLDSFRVPCPQ